MNSSPEILVSVIMPAYKATGTLDQAVTSVINQSWPNWELLIVEDGSEDGTLEKAMSWAEVDRRIKVFSNGTNMGVSAARNRALDHARGDYVAFLDSDDFLMPEKIRIQIEYMQNTGAKFTYTSYQRMREGGMANVVIPPIDVDYGRMLKGSVIAIMTGMIARPLIEGVRFHDIGHEDYLFWLNILQKTDKAVRVPTPEPLAVYRIHALSRSSDLVRNVGWQWKIYREELCLPICKSLPLMGNYAYHAISKRIFRFCRQ